MLFLYGLITGYFFYMLKTYIHKYRAFKRYRISMQRVSSLLDESNSNLVSGAIWAGLGDYAAAGELTQKGLVLSIEAFTLQNEVTEKCK